MNKLLFKKEIIKIYQRKEIKNRIKTNLIIYFLNFFNFLNEKLFLSSIKNSIIISIIIYINFNIIYC